MASHVPLFSHVDVRVRNRSRSIVFYDGLFAVLRDMVRSDGKSFTTWDVKDTPPDVFEWFDIVEDPAVVPNANRIAFSVSSKEEVDRVAAVLPTLGAAAVEGPDFAYGPKYYAVFFEDPDGHKLEVCHVQAAEG